MKKLSLILVCFLMIFAVACSKSKSHSPCDGITCSGHGVCDDSSGRAVCKCDPCYVQSGTDECVLDEGNPECAEPNDDDVVADMCGECGEYINGACHAKQGKCLDNSDCGGTRQCDTQTCFCFAVDGPCQGIDCGGHGECKEGAGYGSGYGSGSDYQSGDVYCDCEDGYHGEIVNGKPTCVPIDDPNNDDEDTPTTDTDDDIVKCELECNLGDCIFAEDGSQQCECPEGYVNENNDPTKPCGEDKCKDVSCEDWQECNPVNGKCIVVYPSCNGDSDCHECEVCDLADHKFVEDKCKIQYVQIKPE